MYNPAMYSMVATVSLIAVTSAITLPLYFPKCLVDDPCISDCIVEAAKKLRPRLERGIKELSIGPIKPLTIKHFNISHKAADANFKLRAKNLALYGMQHYDLVDLEFSPKKVLLQGVMKFGDVHAFFGYCSEGHVISIPVSGKGFIKGLLGPANVTFVLKGDLVRIRGVEYCNLNDLNIKYKLSKFSMSFDGLQRKKGPWGDTNVAFKENSKEVARALEPVIEEIIKTFLVKYMKWFLREIPYSKLFPHST